MPKSIPLKITATQRNHLEALYLHLGTVADDAFGMIEFLVDDTDYIYPEDAYGDKTNYCGSVACMVGHAPGAGVKPTPKDNNDWHLYAANKLGAVYSRHLDPSKTPEPSRLALWKWCFDSDWAGRDDTVAGGRTRLRIALDTGIPHNYLDQLVGNDPLSYSVTA